MPSAELGGARLQPAPCQRLKGHAQLLPTLAHTDLSPETNTAKKIGVTPGWMSCRSAPHNLCSKTRKTSPCRRGSKSHTSIASYPPIFACYENLALAAKVWD